MDRQIDRQIDIYKQINRWIGRQIYVQADRYMDRTLILTSHLNLSCIPIMIWYTYYMYYAVNKIILMQSNIKQINQIIKVRNIKDSVDIQFYQSFLIQKVSPLDIREKWKIIQRVNKQKNVGRQ